MPISSWRVLLPLLILLPRFVVAQAGVTISLTATPNPSVYGSAVTLTSKVSPAGATGKVTFYDGVTVLGISSIAGGQASTFTFTFGDAAGVSQLLAVGMLFGTPTDPSKLEGNQLATCYINYSPVNGVFFLVSDAGYVGNTVAPGTQVIEAKAPYPSTKLSATNIGGGTYSWSLTGLPAGLQFDSSSATIFGTPTSPTGSPFTVQVTATANNLTVNRAYSLTIYGLCDLNHDAATNVADVQLVINQALGMSPAVNDLNGDGTVNVADVQIIINAALGLGCAAK